MVVFFAIGAISYAGNGTTGFKCNNNGLYGAFKRFKYNTGIGAAMG